ncbi:MAG: aminopeptidase P family N-terminal domain-containing protein [Bilophila wadsworthia]
MSSPDLLPLGEIEFRYARCRRLLRTLAPDAGGMLVTSRLGIYYLTGTLGWGLVWLPVEGEPVLLLRKGVERAQLESPLRHILPFKSYKITSLCAGGSPLSSVIAVDKNGFNWSMARCCKAVWKVCVHLCDAVLAQARAVKSEWELENPSMRALHAKFWMKYFRNAYTPA